MAQKRRLDPTITTNDIRWSQIHDKFNHLVHRSDKTLGDILLDFFSPQEASLFFKQESPDLQALQASNTQRYRELMASDQFKGTSKNNIVTKLTMMYFGLPVEPIQGSLLPASRPDEEALPKLEAEISKLKPLFFLDKDELRRVIASEQVTDGQSRDVPVVSKSVLTVQEQVNLLRALKSMRDIAAMRAFPCPFDGCDFVFNLHDLDDAKCHILRYHVSKKCIWCDETHFEWWNEAQRQQHLRQKHRDKLLITLGIKDIKLISSSSAETATIALTRIDLSSGGGGAAAAHNASNLAGFINGPARQIVEFFCCGCGRDNRNFSSPYEREYHERTCQGRSGNGGVGYGDYDSKKQQRTFCAECGDYTASVDDKEASKASCGHNLTSNPGQGKFCVLCGIDATRLGDKLADMHRASCRGMGSACRPFCSYCGYRVCPDDSDDTGDRQRLMAAHRAVCISNMAKTGKPPGKMVALMAPEARQRKRRLSTVVESREDDDDDYDDDDGSPATAPAAAPATAPPAPIMPASDKDKDKGARKSRLLSAVAAKRLGPSSETTAEDSAYSSSAEERCSLSSACSSSSGDEFRPSWSTLSSNDLRLEQGISKKKKRVGKSGKEREEERGREKEREREKEKKDEQKATSYPQRRAESPDWVSLLGPGDSSFVADNRYYCSKCLRRVPKVGPRRKGQIDGEVEVEREYELHLAGNRCCRIRNGVGSAESLPNRSGWIPASKMPRLGTLKAAFIEAHPDYKATIFPLLPSDVRHNVWRSDPNNRGNQSAWTLPWPPYYAGRLPGEQKQAEAESEAEAEVEAETEEAGEEEEEQQSPEEERETVSVVSTGSLFTSGGVSSWSSSSAETSEEQVDEEEQSPEEEPETVSVSVGSTGSLFVTSVGMSSWSSSLSDGGGKEKWTRRRGGARKKRVMNSDGSYFYESESDSADLSSYQYSAEKEEGDSSKSVNDSDYYYYYVDDDDDKDGGGRRRKRRRRIGDGTYRPPGRGEDSDSDQELASGPERLKQVREEMEQEMESIRNNEGGGGDDSPRFKTPIHATSLSCHQLE